MRNLRIAFSDQTPGFNPTNNRIWDALKTHYRLELSKELSNAEVLVFSDFGTEHWKYQGKKIYLTGENMLPDFGQCDLAFTPAEIEGDERAVRLPLYAQYIHTLPSLIREPNYDARSKLNRQGFCSFIASNPICFKRNNVFRAIHRRRAVASGGAHFNTIGELVRDKLEFLKSYQFNIACENSSSPGYLTEKLTDALIAGAIPIYWGDPEINRDFNPGCMINVNSYSNLDDLVDHVLQIADNDALRLNILQAAVFKDNKLPTCAHDKYIAGPIINLVENQTAGIRNLKKRRIREHIKEEKGFLAHKLEKGICKVQSRLWKLGLRF